MRSRIQRWLSLLLSAFMVLSLAACAGQEELLAGMSAAGSAASSSSGPDADADSVPEVEAAGDTSLADQTADWAADQQDAAPDTSGAPSQAPPEQTPAEENPVPSMSEALLPEDGSYTSRDDVALYIHQYGHLPDNFISRQDAEKLGWPGGSLDPYAPGMCIGGSRFGNYEGLLPDADGRFWTECDIDTLGADSRGARRIVFSNDGLIYYTDDHYASFTLLYGEEIS